MFTRDFFMKFWILNMANMAKPFCCVPKRMIVYNIIINYVGRFYFFGFFRTVYNDFSLRLRRTDFSFRSNPSISLRIFSNSRRFLNFFRLRIVCVKTVWIFHQSGKKHDFIRYLLGFMVHFICFMNISVYEWACWFITENCLTWIFPVNRPLRTRCGHRVSSGY